MPRKSQDPKPPAKPPKKTNCADPKPLTVDPKVKVIKVENDPK